MFASAQSEASLYVNPPTVTASVGQSFSININITGVQDLFGWQFELDWNSSLLNVTSISEGSFLSSGGTTFFSYTLNDTAGSIVVDGTLTGQGSGVDGDGVLATVTFNVLSSGQSPLTLTGAELADSNDNPISVSENSGYFNSQIHDVAITQVSASPTTLLLGGLVSINVTAADLGNYAENFSVSILANSQVIGEQQVSLASHSSVNLG
jgi:hypothetical protein